MDRSVVYRIYKENEMEGTSDEKEIGEINLNMSEEAENIKTSEKVYGNMDEKEQLKALNLDEQDTPPIILPLQIPPQKTNESMYIQKNVKMKEKQGKEYGGQIIETPTTCFGDIEFRGSSRRHRAKFIRLSDDTPPSVIYKLMVTYWRMDRPRLLISVTGGAKSFNMDPMLKQNFTVGLSKVATTPGCWVISGGTNAGVMKHVGDALQGSTKACIGIATWGVISKREELNPATARTHAGTVSDSRGNKYTYEVGSWLTEKGAFLDSNHTHFLLVDNGTENTFGVEIPFRGQLEKYIMAKAVRDDKYTTSVPSVLLVLEGGPGTLGTIYSAVAGDNPVPVVIVKSSGRAADLLVYALTLSTEIIETNKACVHEGLMSGINTLFPELLYTKKKAAYDQIIECLKFEHMFTISQVGTDVDIDDAILTALLNDTSTNSYRQLQLTLAWNRADLARDKILATMLTWGDENNPMELQWIAIMSLAMDNVEFLQLLLGYGVCIGSFLTNDVLEFLYGYRSHYKSSPLRYEFNEKDYIPASSNSENVSVYKKLCSYEELITMKTAAIPRSLIEKLITELCENFIKVGDERFIEDLSLRDDSKDAKVTFKYPMRELFFWAVLNNMQSMAVFFWKHGEEHMAKSLIGAHMCETLVIRRINQGDVETALLESSSIFKDGALQLLDECYKTDEKKTRTLITSNFNQFNGVSILNLAVGAENLDFVSHYSVQGLLEDVWVGNMKIREISLIKTFISYLIPFLVYFVEFRTEEEILTMVKTEEVFEEEFDDLMADDEMDDDCEVDTIRRMTIKEREAKVERGQGTPLTFCRKLVEFYWRTPVVTFVSHVVAYVAFLILFSYVSMLQKTSVSPLEWLLIVTVFAYFVAEIYQIIQVDAPSVKLKFIQWSCSSLNLFDALAITLYFVAVGMRFSQRLRKFGHTLYAIDCGLWIFRILSISFISPTLGPYLVMIKRMSKDLIIFLCVLFVVIIGYGVITSAILHPLPKADIQMLRNAIWQPYFNIYGELFIDREPNDNSTTRFGTPVRDSYDETVVWVLMGMYLLFTNILLLNLLIAVFNNTYNQVQAKASQIWAFKRHHLIMEYADRHALFPPFSLLGHTVLFIRWLFRKCTGATKTDISGLRSLVNEEQREDLLEFECDCMTVMSRRKYTCISKTVEEMSSEILEEMDNMKSEMIVIKEKLHQWTEVEKEEPEGSLRRFSSVVEKELISKRQTSMRTKDPFSLT